MTGGSALGYGLNAGSASGSVSGGQPSANAAPVQSGGAASNGVRFWTGGAVTIGERDADSGQAGFSVRSTGISMGVDFAVNPNFDLGFGGGFGEESADIGSADSEVDSKQFSGVIYGSLRPQSGVFIDAMLGYGSLEFDMQRRVTIDGSLVMGEAVVTAQLYHHRDQGAGYYLGLFRRVEGQEDYERELQQRHAELRQAYLRLNGTQEKLLQSEKMASIGQLAAGVAQPAPEAALRRGDHRRRLCHWPRTRRIFCAVGAVGRAVSDADGYLDLERRRGADLRARTGMASL